jgi:hypothetical protein
MMLCREVNSSCKWRGPHMKQYIASSSTLLKVDECLPRLNGYKVLLETSLEMIDFMSMQIYIAR